MSSSISSASQTALTASYTRPTWFPGRRLPRSISPILNPVRAGGRMTGQQLIFHTVSGQYGESIEVRSLSEEPVQATHSAMLSTAVDPIERHRDRERRRHFDKADLVVSGKVLAVTLPADEQAKSASKTALAAATTTRRKPVSEHDPKWRNAVVEVDE